MSFKSLLDAWAAEEAPTRTAETYQVHLTTEDAAKIHALAELFPGVDHERVITDLLSLAVEMKPQRIVDAATLTGACVVALGTQCAGVFTRHDELRDEVMAIDGVGALAIDVTSKPPGTIEWE